MSKIKTCNKWVFVAFCAFGLSVLFSAIANDSAFAAGNLIESGNARWEYELSGNPQKLTLKYYDKTPSASTITVPSLDWLKANVPGASADLDTYYLRNADPDQQDIDFPSETRRTPTTDTTVLDMTGTSKIQILGVRPLINPDVETELKFGSNMVLGDDITVEVSTILCKTMTYYSGNYQCNADTVNFPAISTEVEKNIPGWDDMTADEKMAYVVEPELLGYKEVGTNGKVSADEYDSSAQYIYNRNSGLSAEGKSVRGFVVSRRFSGSAFSGYKLKLTNFNASNFNYVGWNAFKDSTFNASSTTITISGDAFGGSNIFQNTNVKNITINTDNYGAGLFRDCQNITSVTFGDSVTRINDSVLAGTNLTSYDFSGTNVKTIGPRAFEGASLTSVNLAGIEKIDYQAFKDNDIRELYLPKSLLYPGAALFDGNSNLKKVTVAYDTMTSGTISPFWVVLSNRSVQEGSNRNDNPLVSLEELIVLAPYAEDEPVGATHVSYDDYRWHYDSSGNYHENSEEACRSRCWNGYALVTQSSWNASSNSSLGLVDHQEYVFEDLYANVESYKNVIAPFYFSALHDIKKIVIGEGYEFVGSSAFWYIGSNWNGWPVTQAADGTCREYWYSDRQWHEGVRCKNGVGRYLEKIQLPETLKGVGNLAFEGSWATHVEVNLPNSLEFIGLAAFRNLYHMDGDFDLPNIKYIGDHAFRSTALDNITIHDQIYYWGIKAFTDIPTLKNITIDCDLYDPDRQITWAYIDKPNGDSNDNKLETFRIQFGYYDGGGFGGTAEEKERWGIREVYSPFANYSEGTIPMYGKITFTEKVVHEIPRLSHVDQWGGNIDGTTSTGNWFGYTAAEEIDLSATQWKIVPRRFMNQVYVDKLTLPHSLEIISHHAFTNLITQNNVVIPDSVRIIGTHAFECYKMTYDVKQNSYKDPETGRWVYEYYRDSIETPHIPSLPSSLEYVGYRAFWGDKNLTGDLYAPNLKYIAPEAFMDTNIRDVYIPEGVEWLAGGTFWSPSLRDITIDADFGKIASTPYSDSFDVPDYYVEWAGSLTNAIYEIESSYIYDYTHSDSSCWDPYDYGTCGSFDGTYNFETLSSVFIKGYRATDQPEDYMVPAITASDQLDMGDAFGNLVFTDKNVTDIDGSTGVFSGLTFNLVDMGETSWTKIANDPYAFNQAHIGTLILPNGLKTVTEGAFFDATIDEEFSLPDTTKTIGRAAFQSATGHMADGFAEGLKDIDEAAFYDADMMENVVIPSTVEHIGESAFNAGSKDVAYDTVTIKPSLDFDATDNQLVHQIFWDTTINELIIDSDTLPALEYPDEPFNQEFWNMDITSVEINNLPGISYGAFDSCTNLKSVDMSKNSAIRTIGEEAFINDEKLDTIKFGPAVKNETIVVMPNAFEGTAFTELGDSTTGFDLTAAKFDATPGHSFANMSKLKKVTVPRNFSNATIPEYTFYNDALLEEAIVDYKITDIKNAAFAKDDNLKRIFIWGDTIVQDQSLDGYTAPTRGPSPTVVGPTIPAGTDIYAYSTAKTEAYAASEQREDFAGKFYPLDEVLYLTSNHPTVLLNEDDTDFDKSDLVVYAMRRDGIILESDSWQEFDGNAYARAGKGLTFEHMAETIAEDEAFGTVWDTPVPLNELDLSNQNFANLAYSIRPATDDPAVLTVDLKHTDKYTTYLANTNVDPRDYVPEPIPDPTPDPTPDPEPEPIPVPTPPKTLDEVVKFASIFAGSGIAAAAIYFVVRRRR
ncbi:leucine-rich repeat protein [Candidatus Saccharibacteria bacterium]|nr:leucine-rich repeat protein [Candidatus Saccharibacteria bacterium]